MVDVEDVLNVLHLPVLQQDHLPLVLRVHHHELVVWHVTSQLVLRVRHVELVL